jgi:hypothetical protein
MLTDIYNSPKTPHTVHEERQKVYKNTSQLQARTRKRYTLKANTKECLRQKSRREWKLG